MGTYKQQEQQDDNNTAAAARQYYRDVIAAGAATTPQSTLGRKLDFWRKMCYNSSVKKVEDDL